MHVAEKRITLAPEKIYLAQVSAYKGFDSKQSFEPYKNGKIKPDNHSIQLVNERIL
ncbi:hypothetical protein EVI01_02480 [Enterococcus villorum]|uniref:Uncharacterized protein n=1 Tax=Enterococcus villorum TaxID=112904 RepID=A0A511IYS7_9ENTE|nr:hypothetical protein EVI01_02480 [Enterococcus villorum]